MLRDVIANPALRPEKAWTYEFAVGGTMINSLALSLNGFLTEVKDKVQLQPVGDAVMANNIAEIRTLGIETELNYYHKYINAYGNLSYQRSTSTSTVQLDRNPLESETPLYPPLMFKGGVTLQLPQIFLKLNVEGSYWGPRRSSGRNTEIYSVQNYPLAKEYRAYELTPYAPLDATVSSWGLKLWGGVETRFSFHASNLLAQHYAFPGFTTSAIRGFDIPGPGRKFFLEIEQFF
jgi:outer membrane receptor protein involved in Fe transport